MPLFINYLRKQWFKGNINPLYLKISQGGFRNAVMNFNEWSGITSNLRFFLGNIVQDALLLLYNLYEISCYPYIVRIETPCTHRCLN